MMRRSRPNAQAGFTLGELSVVLGIIALVTAVATPAFLSYGQAAKLKAGAQELVTIINRGRHVAITRNTPVCVQQSANKVRFVMGTCAGTVWTGPGTDALGWITLPEDLQVSAATANVVFTHLGTASTAGTYTVRNASTNQTLSVSVALSGRVTIGS